MGDFASDIAFTPSVKSEQARRGSRAGYQKMAEKRDWNKKITDELRAFLETYDSFYFATATADGQPYIQHRGGSPGVLKALDDETLAFADFSGNRQYITIGNLAENDKAHIFLMDYENKRRVKIWGRAKVAEDDAALVSRLVDPSYKAQPERAILFTVSAWDINCPQHIPQKFDLATVEKATAKLTERIAALEAELSGLRKNGKG